MDLMQGILTRRSIRTFDPDQKVSAADVKALLKAAMYAPSAMNRQAWSFVVVDDKKMLEKIEQVHPYAAFASEAGLAIVVCTDPQESYEAYWRVDPLLAGQNILLAAHELGLGACWCGVYPDETRMKIFREMLKMPATVQPMALIIVGHPVIYPGDSSDRYQETKIHHNQW